MDQSIDPSIPPSVKAHHPLTSSYLYSSITNREDQATQTTSEWIMGIDEAGRGPVLGMYCTTYYPSLSLPRINTFVYVTPKS